EHVLLPVAAIWLAAASECPGQRAADGWKPGMLDGCARRARAELCADRCGEVGVDQRVGHVLEGQWREASGRGEVLELAVFTPGDGTWCAGGRGRQQRAHLSEHHTALALCGRAPD